MMRSTIGDLLDGDLLDGDLDDHCLYLVRDCDVVFYVGQSREPVNRLWSHLGRGWGAWSQNSPSALGVLIADNLPAARSWQVEFLTPGEVSGLAVKGYASDWDIDKAERSLIKEHRPCLNVANNNNPSSLPERYRRTDLDVTVSDFVPW
jgi:hypothetical protein